MDRGHYQNIHQCWRDFPPGQRVRVLDDYVISYPLDYSSEEKSLRILKVSGYLARAGLVGTVAPTAITTDGKVLFQFGQVQLWMNRPSLAELSDISSGDN